MSGRSLQFKAEYVFRIPRVDLPFVVGMVLTKLMTNDEISSIAVNALMDKIASMVKQGKSTKGLSEDEHAIAMAHVIMEVSSTHVLLSPEASPEQRKAYKPLEVVYALAIRAVKNCSQMRQVAEKRGILAIQEKGGKIEDVFNQYSRSSRG